jgi:hypothetical protein
MVVQVPTEPGKSQRWHPPPHGLSQQTLSATNPEAHSPFSPTLPLPNSASQLFAILQKYPLGQVVVASQ